MYNVVPTPKFEADIKFYIKKKKYFHITDDIEDIVGDLEKGIFVGDEISEIDAHNKTYKVRAANSDCNTGKSNGYRLIYYAIAEDLTVYLLTIYSKKDDFNIPTDQEIKAIILKFCS